MARYVIERELPGVGKMTEEDLRNISQKSNEVLDEMGPDIEWVESFVTNDKIYCIYNATDKDQIIKHAEKGGFPADRIEEVRAMISPATAQTQEL